jgi:hypothetical protein
MIELLILTKLMDHFVMLVDRKNQNRWFIWILPLLWFGLQVLFACLAGAAGSGHPGMELQVYGLSLVGGFLGAGISFWIIRCMPLKTLKCPECGWEFTEHGPLGLECAQCKAWLKVFRGKVDRI